MEKGAPTDPPTPTTYRPAKKPNLCRVNIASGAGALFPAQPTANNYIPVRIISYPDIAG